MTDERSPLYSKAALTQDLRHLASTLEAVHPEPYSGHGGRVAFHRRLEASIRDVPQDGESLSAFYERVRRFVTRLRDGHTTVVAPDDLDSAVDGRLPVDWRVVGEALFVEAVYTEDHADLLGARLRSVEGIEAEALRERQARITSADNRYGDWKQLARSLGAKPGRCSDLVGQSALPVEVTFERPDGSLDCRRLGVVEADHPVATLESTVGRPETNGRPAYRLLDDGTTALLVLPDCHSHREVHEVVAAPGGPAETMYDTEATYRRTVGEPVPDSHEEMVADIPSATDVLGDLADAMAEAGTERLVVDTRGNTGGTSILPFLLTYVLHGWDGVEATVADQYDAVKTSDEYRDHLGDQAPVETTENPAGFDFSSYFADPAEEAEQVRAQLRQMSPTLSQELEAGEHEDAYRPENVVVVTNAETFSAGMEIPVLLSKLGAEVVGVPSSQSPNGPRDKLTVELPTTGLELTVSYRYHVFLPDAEGTVLRPDRPLTPDRFDAYDRAADAGVRLALDGQSGES